ncbi:MAG: hypothetical protein MRZ28_07700 [Oscillospiraceae bacterium]|nr:hypothetical protein [Oscillospiraceae bacterium]MDY3219394.1 hypothetical protein [Candidatus Fimivivens sp.]SFI65187.1 hypothetical protein SAMN02910435_00494 [Ruminococcaceae bacterium D5]
MASFLPQAKKEAGAKSALLRLGLSDWIQTSGLYHPKVKLNPLYHFI